MRDNQKQRVYDSELRVGRRFKTVPEMQAYVDKITESAWYRKNVARPKRIVVKDGRGRRSAAGWRELDGRGVVAMPHWSRSEVVLLHEMAHTIEVWGKHGPRWAGVFLGLIDRKLGREAAENQMAKFRERGVEWKLPAWWRHG